MTEADLMGLEAFESVWARVQAGKAEVSPEGQSSLEPVLQGLYDLWRGYTAVGAAASGRMRRCLRSLGTETRSMFRELQTGYFLEKGDIFIPSETTNFASCTPYNLRKLWKNAINLAERLQNAEDPVCGPFADTVRRQTDTLLKLIRNALK